VTDLAELARIRAIRATVVREAAPRRPTRYLHAAVAERGLLIAAAVLRALDGIFDGWRRALRCPTAMGLAPGRALLYASSGDGRSNEEHPMIRTVHAEVKSSGSGSSGTDCGGSFGLGPLRKRCILRRKEAGSRDVASAQGNAPDRSFAPEMGR
jgi:hypothetical protein